MTLGKEKVAMPAPAAPAPTKCATRGCPNKGTKKCGSCQSVWYCSRECQVADWGTHKQLCRRFSAAVREATAAIKEATTAALSSLQPPSEATDQTGPFLFAHTAAEEWAGRRAYLDDKVQNTKGDLSEERLAQLKRALEVADAGTDPLDKLIRLKRFIDEGKAAKEAAAALLSSASNKEEEGKEKEKSNDNEA